MIQDQVIHIASTGYPERYGHFLGQTNHPNTKAVLNFQNGIHDVEHLIQMVNPTDLIALVSIPIFYGSLYNVLVICRAVYDLESENLRS